MCPLLMNKAANKANEREIGEWGGVGEGVESAMYELFPVSIQMERSAKCFTQSCGHLYIFQA